MKIGSLVECVQSIGPVLNGTNSMPYNPKKGELYVVQAIIDKDVIRLKECYNPHPDWVGYMMRCFKEVQPPIEIIIEELQTEFI